MNQPFQNQVAVVTGGTQGIGWALVQALAAQGATVYGCGFSAGSLAQAEASRAALPTADRIHLAQRDVTDQAAITDWIEQIVAENGRLDLLINNAAFVRWQDVLAMSVADAQRTMRVAYDGMVFATRAALPPMLAANRGHIVNVGSVAGLAFVGGASAAYAAAKAALDAYTQILQVELAETAVHATIVRLGTVGGTDFFKKHVSNERMPPFTRFLPPLTPPRVATAVLRAVQRRQMILTLPRYYALLVATYQLFPRFARWLAGKGGPNRVNYGDVDWE